LKPVCLGCEYCLFNKVRAVICVKHCREFDFPYSSSCKVYGFCCSHLRSPLLGFPAYVQDVGFAKVGFLCSDRISEPYKPLVRPWITAFYQDIIAADKVVVNEPAFRSNFFPVGPDLEYTLVKLGPLVISGLAHLRNSP